MTAWVVRLRRDDGTYTFAMRTATPGNWGGCHVEQATRMSRAEAVVAKFQIDAQVYPYLANYLVEVVEVVP